MSASTAHLPHPRRAVEADGTVHAARYAGSRTHFTTACAVYPAPEVVRIDPRPDRAVTCPACLDALPTECPGYPGPGGSTVHPCCRA
ncbi:hypothetical protein [Streptomyces triculaminicus]|uniref:hypothetical protein n=1 Tax=Streptomyces triculaminicus TaxID=2816232 RepID=UPI0037A7EC06